MTDAIAAATCGPIYARKGQATPAPAVGYLGIDDLHERFAGHVPGNPGTARVALALPPVPSNGARGQADTREGRTDAPGMSSLIERREAFNGSASAPADPDAKSAKRRRKASPARRRRYQFTVRLTRQLHLGIKRLAKRTGRTYQDILAEAAKAHLEALAPAPSKRKGRGR